MSIKKDSLGDRMKTFYEAIPKIHLVRRIPVIIRLDGKAFHSFCKGFKRPFDNILIKSMQKTMQYLCENIQGCVLGYTQSDEITLVLRDDFTINTSAWFDYNVEKMCSISASMATMAFNKFFHELTDEWFDDYFEAWNHSEEDEKLNHAYFKALEKGAMFDARVFNIPREECTNALIWRQQDATRNSIQMVGQANFSHKQLQGLSCDQIQEKLWQEKNINWNDFATVYKRGSCCKKTPVKVDRNIITYEGETIPTDLGIIRNKWIIDTEIPIFTQDRGYIEEVLK